MKNELVLENYGVQELQAVEKIDVDGGFLFQAIVGAAVYAFFSDRKANVKAFNEGRSWAANSGYTL